MVRNRDLINKSITALESKLEALRRHVEREWPIKDFKKLLQESINAVGVIKSNVKLTRNNDILARELNALSQALDILSRNIEGRSSKEDFYRILDRAVKSLDALDHAIQREPVDGYEISSPGKVNN